MLGYWVARRTAEIGLRLALGASRQEVLRGVLRESAVLVAIGAAVGVPAVVLLSRALTSVLFEVTPTDPAIVAGSDSACSSLVCSPPPCRPGARREWSR